MSFAVTATNPVVSNLAGHRDVYGADQGQYFVAITPTPGTGIIGGGSVQAFTETAPIFLFYNPGPYSVYPMSLRTHLTVVGSNATPTIDYWTFSMDLGNRWSSAGTTLTSVNTGNVNVKSAGFIKFGAVVATAATPSRRIIGHITSKADDESDGGLEVIHDTLMFQWGDTVTGSSHATRANTTTPTYAGYGLPPCVIGPNMSLVIVRWSASQVTGSTNEVQFSWMEK